METDFSSQHRPIPWSFGGTCASLHGIRVDAEWKRARIRWEKSRNQPVAIGVLARKYIGLKLTQVQLLDIGRGLSCLHSLEIVHGNLKGVRLGSFFATPRSAPISQPPISG